MIFGGGSFASSPFAGLLRWLRGIVQPTPASRTFVVSYEERATSIAPETRTIILGAEDRTGSVGVETRVFVVGDEIRGFTA